MHPNWVGVLAALCGQVEALVGSAVTSGRVRSQGVLPGKAVSLVRLCDWAGPPFVLPN